MRISIEAAVLAGVLACSAAWAQTTWPDRPIRVVVATPAGGPVDLLARILGESVSRRLQQPVIIDNKVGASGSIGISYLTSQAPDGYTVLLSANAAHSLMPVVRKVAYKPLDDFTFLGQLAFTPNVFVVPATSPAKTLREFVDLARAQPGKFNYGTMLGIPQHVDFERFKRDTATDIQLIPFTGGAPIVTAMLGDQIQATLVNVPLVAEWVKSGKLRALATPGSSRLASMPGVPTLAEAGFPDLKLDAGNYYALVAPAGLPKTIGDKLFQAFAAAAAEPEVIQKLGTAGFEASLRDGDTLRSDLVRELADNEKLIKALKLKLE